MGFDQYNNFRGTQTGTDRKGFTTPSPDACDPLQPFMPVPYPASWLPIKRRDEGHPDAAGIVISEGHLVGLDKSGALIPAGYFCGTQATKANGGQYCAVVYSQYDVNTVYNPQTVPPRFVQTPGEYVVLAAPSDAAPGDVITLPNGTTINVTAGDIAFAQSCNLIPGGFANAVGYAIRNVFIYIGGIEITGTTGGMQYLLLTQRPDLMQVTNYMHEMGTSIRTHFVLRLPWIGADLTTLGQWAQIDGLQGYVQTDFSRSFAHFTGIKPGMTPQLVLNPATIPNPNYITPTLPNPAYPATIPAGTGWFAQFSITNPDYVAGSTATIANPVYTALVAAGGAPLAANTVTIANPAYNAGADPSTLTAVQVNQVNGAGQFFIGCSVVPSGTNNGADAGNYAPFNPAVNSQDAIVGKVLGVELMYPIRDFANRVRTQFERANTFVGPRMDPNPVTFQMGGSATKGMDYAISLATNGAFQAAITQQKPLHDEYSTYVLVHVNCR